PIRVGLTSGLRHHGRSALQSRANSFVSVSNRRDIYSNVCIDRSTKRSVDIGTRGSRHSWRAPCSLVKVFSVARRLCPGKAQGRGIPSCNPLRREPSPSCFGTPTFEGVS